MIKNINDYLEALLKLEVSVSSLEDALKLINTSNELKEVLNNPNVTIDEKRIVIDELFAPSVKDIIEKLASQCKCDELSGLIDAYI